MRTNGAIDYVEFTVADLLPVKAFYAVAFGWSFTDYGPDYTAFSGAGLEGGFARSPTQTASQAADGGALVVLYADDLEAMEERVRAAGGEICKPIFTFPGGRRFHFRDPGGCELAVWSAHGASP